MKSKIHVFSRMFKKKFTEQLCRACRNTTKVNMLLFILFAGFAVPSAWATDYLSRNGEVVNIPCTGTNVVYADKNHPEVKSFVIYDDGGSGKNYSNNCDGRLQIYALEGYGIKVSGWIMAEALDTLSILDGTVYPLIANIPGTGVNSKKEFGPFYTTVNMMTVSFFSDGSLAGPGFLMNVEFVPLREASGSSLVWFYNPYDWLDSKKESQIYSEGMTVSFGFYRKDDEDNLWGLVIRRKDGGGMVEYKKNENTGMYEFVMPSCNVYVSVNNEGTEKGFNLFNTERSLFLYGAETINVYDNGGPDYPYTNNFDGWLSLSTKSGFHFKVTGTVETEPSTGNWDYLEIYEGEKSALGKLICKVYTESGSSTTKVEVPSNCVSSSEYMTLHFRTDGSNSAPGIYLTVSSVGNVHSVKVLNTDPNGRITSDVSSAGTGSRVTVTANPNSGYVFRGVKVVNKTTGDTVFAYDNAIKDNKVTFSMLSADVEVTPVFVKDTYSITKDSVTGGSVSGVSSAKVGNTVTMTAYPSNGYLFNGVTVDQNGRSLSVSGGKGFMNRTFSFTMPLGDVTVTPSFTNDWSVDGGLYINMPTTGKLSATIPAGVQSFKVYDDGGKNGYYSGNSSGTLVLTAPSGYVLKLFGSMETYYSGDYLTVCDGSDTTKTKLMYQKYGSISNIGKLYSSGQSMTLYFHSTYGSAYRSGLDLTVTLIPVENQIAYESVNSGGSVTDSSPKKANYGSTVSYTYDYTSGYLVRDIKIDAENGNAVEVNGGWYTNKTVSFKMPPSNVTVKSTYTNDLTADGGLYINMPKTGTVTATIPAGVQSFKVYDDGGKSGYYSHNGSGTLVLTAPSGHYLQLSGSVDLYTLFTLHDYLTVCDGTDTTKTKLLDQLSGSSKDIGFVYSSGQSLTLYFNSDEYGDNLSGLDLTVNVMSYEKQITYKNTNDGGSVVSSSPTKANYGSTVNYTYDYTSGYLVSDIKVVGDNSYVVKASGGWYNNKKASFKMPPVNVTVKSTYTNDWSADGGLYIDMPKTGTVYATIPDGVKSFKVYDDGGEKGQYSKNSNGILVLTAPTGYFFEMSGKIRTAYTDRSDKDYTYTCANDYLSVYEGSSTTASALILNKTGCTATSGTSYETATVVSKGNTMTLNFKSDGTGDAESGLDLMVKLHKLTPELVNGQYVNMVLNHRASLSIPEGVESFKVYDNGGKDDEYLKGFNDTLVLSAPSGYVLSLSGNISTGYESQAFFQPHDYTCNANDNLSVYDGPSSSATALLLNKTSDCYISTGPALTSIGTVTSRGANMTLVFKSNEKGVASKGLDLTVTLHKLALDLADDGNGNKYVNMVPKRRVSLTIPAYVSTFKVYDNGGKDNYYINNSSDTLVLKAPAGYVLQLSGNVSTITKDTLFVDDGANVNANRRLGTYEGLKSIIDKVISSGEYMTLWFKSDESYTYSGLDLTVTLVKLKLEPKYDGTSYYVDMVYQNKATFDIPDTLKSFNVYDDGGKNNDYSYNSRDTLVLKAPAGYILQLSGEVFTDGSGDTLFVYDGANVDANNRLGTYMGLKSINNLLSSGEYMTLRFKSDRAYRSSGLKLTVTLVPLDYAIQVNSAANGNLVASKTTELHVGDTVSLTASANTGYMLKDVIAKDSAGNAVKVSQYSFDVSELIMPAKNLVITPTFTNTLTAAGGLHLDMRRNANVNANIPSGVKSFKVYDNGGKDGVYEANSNDTLTLTAPEGYRIKLTGNVKTEMGWDSLYVFDGGNTSANRLLKISGPATYNSHDKDTSLTAIYSTGERMTLRFRADGSDQYEGLDLTVTLEKINHTITRKSVTGGTLNSKDADTLGAEVYLTGSPTNSYHLSGVTVVDKDENVIKSPIYSFDRSKFTMPASNVTVTPTWTNNLTAEGGLHLELLKNGKIDANIPAGVKSFNLFDNGGAGGNYENSSNDTLTLNAPTGFYLVVTGYVTLENGYDSLYIFDGATTSATKLFDSTSSTSGTKTDIGTITSSGRSLTFRFRSDASRQYSGLNLKVSVEPIAYDIVIANVANGRVSSDKNKAAKDSVVNLSWVYTTGYLIRDIEVKDASENKIAVNGGWYSGAAASFVMPRSAVTVTPSFTNNLTAEGNDGLYINMPKTGSINAEIPAKVKSFKVYDDGGKNGNYSTNGKGTLSLTAPEGYLLELSGSVVIEPPYSSTKIYDYLNVYDGAGKTAKVLKENVTGTVSLESVRSTGNSMTLYFESDVSSVRSGLDLTVTLFKQLTGMAVANIASQIYTGSAICPDVVVTDGQKTLVKNTDYTVTYSDNINIGTATVTITGIGDYAGEVVKTFRIVSKFTPWIGSVADATKPAKVQTGLDNETQTAGYWYVSNDNDYGGLSKVVWEKTPLTTNIVPACGGICGVAELNEGSLMYDPWVMIGFDIVGRTSENDPTLATEDVSAWEGVCLTYKSEAAPELLLGLGDYDEEIGYAYPEVSLPATRATDGKKICVRWSEFKQPEWAQMAKISGEEAAKQLASLNFRIQKSSGEYKFNICAVGPYGSENDLPESCPEQLQPSNLLTVAYIASQIYTGSAICPDVVVTNGQKTLVKNTDYTLTCSDNINVGTATATITGIGDYAGEVVKTFRIISEFTPWIGSVADATKPAKVQTGLDNETQTAGYWYVLNDNSDGGLSKVVLGKTPLTTNIPPACGGICGVAELNEGSLIYDPWVMIGFDIVGQTSANDPTLVTEDVSAWEGVCLTYKSEVAAELLLGLGNYDVAINFANPEVSLPATHATDSKKICVRWSEFKQPKWTATIKITGEEAAKQLASLNFRIQRSSGEYKFNICAVGPYGSENDLPETCPEPLKPFNLLTVADIASQMYSGSAICPELVVKDGEAVLVENTDYTVTCSDNINVGTATATITGIGDYTGVVSKQFSIIPKVVNDFAAVTIEQDENGTYAVIDGNYGGTDAVEIKNDVTVDALMYSRTFPVMTDVYSTIVLPFDVNTSNVYGPKQILKFGGLQYVTENGVKKKAVVMNVVWDRDTSRTHADLAANTPYMVLMQDSIFVVSGPVTLRKTVTPVVRDGDWELRGTLQYKKWYEGDPDLGRVYGFAAEKTSTTEIGQFVKAGAGAWIRPLRAYLIYNPQDTTQQCTVGSCRPAIPFAAVEASLPENIDVVIGDADGEQTTVIGRINTLTGEFKANRTFDLKGRSMTGKPKAKGVYLKKLK